MFDAEMMLEPLVGQGIPLEAALDEVVRYPLLMAASLRGSVDQASACSEIAIPDWPQCPSGRTTSRPFSPGRRRAASLSERFCRTGADLQPTVVDLPRPRDPMNCSPPW